MKNEEIVLEITGVANEGNGVGKYNGIAVFVPFAVTGDIVKVKIVKVMKNYCFGKLLEVIEKSPLRIETDCDIFTKCGGCVYRNIGYSSEIEIKTQKVYDCMKRIGGIDMAPQNAVFGEELRYRNKVQYPCDTSGNIGFYSLRSHRVIPFTNGKCLLQPAEFDNAVNKVSAFFKQSGVSFYNEETKKGVIRHIYFRKGFATGEIMAVLVINGKNFNLSSEFVELLKSCFGENLKTVLLNFNLKDTNVILGKEGSVIYGNGYITDILCGVKIRISPYSFYQVNRDMAEKLYCKAAEYACPENKTVLDLYCGAGTIGLSMANRAKEIIGVEIVSQAVEDAKFNAESNGIKNARFICDDASGAAEKLAKEGIKPDVVILDPPRKGCDKVLLNTVANEFLPERIVYVSCDPATLARDCAILKEFGYMLCEYTPFDLFPRTEHIETVALLSRQNTEFAISVTK